MNMPQNKNEVLDLLCCLRNDFELLRNGEWNPDEDSIDVSLEVLSSVIEYVQEQS